MSRHFDPYRLSSPQIPFWRMLIFSVIASFLALILYQQIAAAFMSNPGLNGFIILVALAGVLFAFQQVIQLFRHVRWVNGFRLSDPELQLYRPPVLLAPMATLLGRRNGAAGSLAITPFALRSILDTIGSRLEEGRDILRYNTGLLIFLGLLGTFWGLLQTISSVGESLQGLQVTTQDPTSLFQELRSGLEAPLSGMGTAFSSSLFGLTGSLILGFMDLQTGQAQNRFYNELEDWLSTLTEIDLHTSSAEKDASLPSSLLQKSVIDLQKTLESLSLQALQVRNSENSAGNAEGGALAESMQALLKHLRHERDMLRIWADKQSQQHLRIEQLLETLSARLTKDPSAVPITSSLSSSMQHENGQIDGERG